MPRTIWILWITPNVLCAVALVIAFRRKCFKSLPCFFANLGYCVLSNVVALAILYSPLVYEQFSVFDYLVMGALQVAMIYELADNLILSHYSIGGFVRSLPSRSLAVLVLLGTVVAALYYPYVRAQELRLWASLNLSTNLIAIGLLLTLVLLTRVVGVSWRSLPAGVALGLGIAATGEVASCLLHAQTGGRFVPEVMRMAAGLMCVLVWLVYLLVPEKTVNASEAAKQMSKLAPRAQELQRFFQP
jgi:hypothetical protein